jgi:DNA-binding response OmpR family regulator
MGRRRVLLVHDEPEMCHSVKKAFEDLGCEVEIAIEPGEAVAHLIERVPDLVCVSLCLPRDSGYDLCELIRGDEALDRVPLVMMSDRHTPEDIAYAEEAGADVFVRLPSPSKSLATVATHLAPLLNGQPPVSAPGLRKLGLVGA